MDIIDIALISTAGCIVALLLFLITGRLYGWALGISDIHLTNKTQIEQNNQILDALDRLIELQTPPDLSSPPGK